MEGRIPVNELEAVDGADGALQGELSTVIQSLEMQGQATTHSFINTSPAIGQTTGEKAESCTEAKGERDVGFGTEDATDG